MFDLSTVGSVASIIGVTVGAIVWLIKFRARLARELKEAQHLTADSEVLAQRVMDSATNAESRSDIVLLVLMRHIDISARQSLASVKKAVVGSVVIFAVGAETDLIVSGAVDLDWRLAIVGVAYAVALVSFGAWLFFDHQLRKMEQAWTQVVMQALFSKVDRHIARKV